MWRGLWARVALQKIGRQARRPTVSSERPLRRRRCSGTPLHPRHSRLSRRCTPRQCSSYVRDASTLKRAFIETLNEPPRHWQMEPKPSESDLEVKHRAKPVALILIHIRSFLPASHFEDMISQRFLHSFANNYILTAYRGVPQVTTVRSSSSIVCRKSHALQFSSNLLNSSCPSIGSYTSLIEDHISSQSSSLKVLPIRNPEKLA